jgi:hypothetical protein
LGGGGKGGGRGGDYLTEYGKIEENVLYTVVPGNIIGHEAFLYSLNTTQCLLRKKFVNILMLVHVLYIA